VKGGLLLDVVVREGPAVLKLLSSEDQPLLVWGNPLLVLDLGLDVLDRIRRLHLKGDSLPGQGLNEDLHSSSEPENEVKSRLLLDVVVRESPAILELLPGEDQPLLVWGNPLLVLDLSLDIFNGVRRLNLESNSLSSQGLDEDLHSSSEPENEVKGGLLLDVVVREGPAVLKLLSSEDQPLLVWGNPLLVLDLGLDVLDRVRRLHFKGDGLPGQRLHENLHPTAETKNEMEGRLLLDVVIREGPAILKLLSGKDEPLLVRGNSLLVLDLGLDVLNGVRRLDLESDSLPGQGLDENLHFQRCFVRIFL